MCTKRHLFIIPLDSAGSGYSRLCAHFAGPLQQDLWGLVVILVHLTMSYFPVVSLGQALAPATACAWGIWLGCLAVSPVILVATYGGAATMAAVFVLLVCLEPIMNNQVR